MLRDDDGSAMLKDRLDNELVVGASLTMSCFCYSIFRADPYIGCQHSCSYCYTRFLPRCRKEGQVIANYSKLFRAALEKWRDSNAPLPPFRLSALTDPFQPLEERVRISLKVMKLASELGLPLIISTKSILITRSPWLDCVKELSDKGLAIVQLSVAFLDDDIAKKLEKGSPLPSERFKAAELLSSEGVPVVLRLQPLIPFLNSSEEFLEDYAKAAHAAGAKHVIIEALRISSWRDLEHFSVAMKKADFVKLSNPTLWELYPHSSHKRPKKEWRQKTYAAAVRELSKVGLRVGLCREGFFDLNTAPDCCGIYLLRERVLRITLYECLYGLKPSYLYFGVDEAKQLPLPGVRRKLNEHFELLRKVLTNRELLLKMVG